jgi:hypothetical protein
LSVESGAYIEGQLKRADNAKREAKRPSFNEAAKTDVSKPSNPNKSEEKEGLKAVGS